MVIYGLPPVPPTPQWEALGLGSASGLGLRFGLVEFRMGLELATASLVDE